jgi:tripartite-type tricarboxylate transporter receptor subunit TctC
MVLNPMTTNKPSYDPARDFAAIAILCASSTSIAVNGDTPFKTLSDLVTYGKANPGKLSYGSAGTGTMSHLSGELFKQRTGIDMVHIPYKGAGPGLVDLVSGHIPVMSPNITGQVLEFHDGGKIRILGINAPTRLKAAPNIPTAIEQGVPGMIGQLFLGIFAPARTAAAIVTKLATATQTALIDDDYQKALIASGFEPFPDPTPDGSQRYLIEEQTRWGPIVQAIGLKMQ